MKVSVKLAILAAFLDGLLLTVGVNAESRPKAVDRVNMDMTVSPCEDFYQYANGSWLKSSTIPAEYPMWSPWLETIERTNSVLREICEQAAANRNAATGTLEQKLGDYYRVAMDTVKIESDGAKPLAGELAYIAGLSTSKDIQQAIARYHSTGIPVLFDVSADVDIKNPKVVMAYFSQGGLGLPDRDYYVRDDSGSVALRMAYVGHINNVLKLLGDDDAAARSAADRIMAFETRLARSSMATRELRDPANSYQVKTVSEANRLTPNFSWDSYLNGIGLANARSISVSPDKFFAEVSAMLTSVSIDDWKAYFRWQLSHFSAPYLSSNFYSEHFRFYSATLTGTTQLRARWKRVLQRAEGPIGELLGQAYVSKSFSPRAKERALSMVNNLLAVMANRIKTLDWMSDTTKKRALEKLAAVTPKIGYPDRWHDYSALQISPDVTYLENIMICRAFEQRRLLDKVGRLVDRTEWIMTPQSTDAYYNPATNEIAFPAGILQPPFFDADADDASNYGAIGVVIGHEITHGFDDMGSQFGPTGALENWWTEADRKAFESRAARLITQYNQYVVVDSQAIDGKLTLGENIADLGGVTIAYYGLQSALRGGSRDKTDGFTPEQRFFISYAGQWRALMRPQVLKLWLNTMMVSPPEYRVRGPLANMPEFGKAFGCDQVAKMLRSLANQIRIW